MKFIKAFVPILLSALILGGCSFRLASSIDDLITPVSPSGENANVQKALDNYCKGSYSLKTPVSGGFTTSYIFYDIDSDSEKEAIVFYEPSSNPGSIDMAVIDKINGEWSVVCNIEGRGSDVYSVDFRDLNGDGSTELIVLWDTFSNSASHVLAVYRQAYVNDQLALSVVGRYITMSNYIAVDIHGDDAEELMVFTVDSGDSISANAVLYSYEDDNLKSLGSTKLDGHISSYKSIISENNGERVYVYADAAKSNGAQMLTEVINWSDYYNTIISPFYNYSTGITKETTRQAMLTSRDIDGDGTVEIPLDAQRASFPGNVEAVNWKKYENSVLAHSCYSVAVEKDNYQIIIPDAYFDRITVSYDYENKALTVSDKSDNIIFTVTYLLKSHYSENNEKYANYMEIMSDSGYIYLAECGNDSDIKITAEDLKSMIKSYEGE